MNKRVIRVVVVEDSQVARELLVSLLSSDPDIAVVGTACDGVEGFETVRRLRPDVVTMDIHLPGMNGFDTTRRIMDECPVPVVIVTADWNHDPRDRTFEALEAGALDILEKPKGVGRPEFRTKVRRLVETVKAMADVKVAARSKWMRTQDTVKKPPVPIDGNLESGNTRIVAFGVSTGGPVVLKSILSRLPAEYPLPIVVALHIVSGFASSFASWLDNEIPLKVVIAQDDTKLCAGHVYIAPGGNNIEVNRYGRVSVREIPDPNAPCPSVAALFTSVAGAYGSGAAGLILTGMGQDGARELKTMRDRGAITFAQDKESSTVHGMPGEAIRIGAAQHIQSPVEMAESLLRLAPQNKLNEV